MNAAPRTIAGDPSAEQGGENCRSILMGSFRVGDAAFQSVCNCTYHPCFITSNRRHGKMLKGPPAIEFTRKFSTPGQEFVFHQFSGPPRSQI